MKSLFTASTLLFFSVAASADCYPKLRRDAIPAQGISCAVDGKSLKVTRSQAKGFSYNGYYLCLTPAANGQWYLSGYVEGNAYAVTSFRCQ